MRILLVNAADVSIWLLQNQMDGQKYDKRLTEEGKEQSKEAASIVKDYYEKQFGDKLNASSTVDNPIQMAMEKLMGNLKPTIRLWHGSFPASREMAEIFENSLKEVITDKKEHYFLNSEKTVLSNYGLNEDKSILSVNQALNTFYRDSDENGIDDVIVICDSFVFKALVMIWGNFTPEWFIEERDPKKCAIKVLDNGGTNGYIFSGF